MLIGWMFRNRWLALGFAALLCWQAVEIAEKADQATATLDAVDPATLSVETGGALPPVQ